MMDKDYLEKSMILFCPQFQHIPDWLDDRIDYVLNLLLAYASNMKPLRTIINRKDFGNGM